MADLKAIEMAVGTMMAALGPYLVYLRGAGGKVLEAAEKKLGEKAFDLLSSRLEGKPKAALEAAAADPDEDNLATLEALVKNAAKRDDALASALADLVKGAGPSLSMTQTGDGNKGIQNVGHGNTYNIG